MKRTITLIFAIMLALAMVMSLAACGGPTLESLTTEGIYYKTVSDKEIHYVFKDGIVTKKVYKAIPYSQSASGKLNSLSSSDEIAKYKDLTETSVTIIDDGKTKEYTYEMNEKEFKVKFSRDFLDSDVKTFEFR